MVRVPRGLTSPAGAYAPGRLRWGPVARPIGRIPIQAYQKIQNIPLQPSNAQAIVSGVTGAPALVQTATGTATAGTTVTVTLGRNTTAGNCLVAYVGTFGTTANPVVIGITLGGAAGNWGAAKTENSPSGCDAEIWVDWNCAGGQTAVVATFGSGSGTVSMTVRVEEWASVQNSSNPVDQSSNGFATSASLSSGTTPATSQANEVFLGCLASGGTITGPASPWSNQPNVTAGAVFMLAGHQVVAATTGLAYTGTTVGTSSWAAVIVSLKAALPVAGAAGLATVQLGPAGLGNLWYPAQVTLSTTTGISVGFDSSVANLYLGPSQVATTLLGTVFGGNGIVAAALPNIQPGLYLIAQWTGATPGDVATMNVNGVMDALG